MLETAVPIVRSELPAPGDLLHIALQKLARIHKPVLLFFKQKTAYEMPKCLEFRRVLSRSARTALDGVSLEAVEGQITAVVGGDGAGKSDRKSVGEGKRVDLRPPATTQK